MVQKQFNFKDEALDGPKPNGWTWWRRRLKARGPAVLWLLLIASLAMLWPFLPVSAAQEPAAWQSLLDKAQQQGRVRVIVSLDVAFQAEDRLADDQRVQQQRQAIRQAQGSVLQKMGGTGLAVVARFSYIPAMTIEVDAAALARLAALPEVAAVTEDTAVPPGLESSLPIIGADQAWAAGFTGEGQTVAILDTGVDKTHPFFTHTGNKVVSEACYSSNSPAAGASSLCPGGAAGTTAPGSGVNCSLVISGCSHGTHVAGIAAGNRGSQAGVAREAGLIAIQVFSRRDDGLVPGDPTPCADAGTSSPCVLSFTTDQIKALERVFELRHAFKIAAVNMSLGGGQFFAHCDNQPIKAIIDNLRAAGIATVIASGNQGFSTSINFPACVSSAVSVGATDDFDQVAAFSNIASFVDLVAPGVDIASSVPGGGMEAFNGTSMATPHVAGAWAVVKQKFPAASVDQILALLQETGTPVNDQRPSGVINGLRRINLGQALGLQDKVYLPIIFTPIGSDLVVECVCGSGLSYTIVRDPAVICPGHVSPLEVTIKNQGTAPVTEPFWVDVYFNPDPAPTGVNQIWDDGRARYGVAWGVTGLALPLEPGETLTLTLDPNDPYLVPIRSSLPPAPLTQAAVYVQVDSANLHTNFGGVLELHEMNNGVYNNIIYGQRSFDPNGSTWIHDDDLAQPAEVDGLPSRS